MDHRSHQRGIRSLGLIIGLGVSLFSHSVLAVVMLVIDITPREARQTVEIEVRDRPKPRPSPPRQEPPAPRQEQPRPTPAARPLQKTAPPQRRAQPPEVNPPPATPRVETPPGPAAPRSFGIRLENTVQAAPGTGIPVPAGETIAADPTVPRAVAKGPGGRGPGGEGDGPPPTTPMHVVRVMPRVLSDSVAQYPAEVRRLGIQGRVVLELVVDEDGRVVFTRVVKPLHPQLDAAALAASKGLKFSPGTVDGMPTRVKIPYSYVFVLE